MGMDAQRRCGAWRQDFFDALRRSSLVSGTPMLRRNPVRTVNLLTMFLLASAVTGVLPTPVLAAQAQAARQHKTMHPKRMEREQVEALEQQWVKAMLASDVPAMDRLLSDDYLGVTTAGALVTKSQQLERMRSRQLMVTKLQTTESRIKLIGHIAIVTSLAEIEAQADGKQVQGSFRSVRVYQRLPNGGWRMTSFEATRVHPGYKLGQRPEGEPGNGG
jgi:ketosteroid isomerase-like protein